ncbi:hypothetical protein Agub_g6940 [Astrephomene gubernaculifera]|uniref:CBM20 domain-containing protein n=1 Tax=Astrephomene gubernaculifera TaxID=47775 RepID=A0AAD3HM14_9CHLO|nr:hypothetical protein Agub_g6940 [Astrephomene gubernaculifera]
MRVSTTGRVDAQKFCPRAATKGCTVPFRQGGLAFRLNTCSIAPSRKPMCSCAVKTEVVATANSPVVVMKVPYRVQYGEVIRVVGSSPLLGEWSADQGLQLTWTDGDVWTAEVPIGAGSYEFKCVVCNAESNTIIRWEDGGNRILCVPDQSGVLDVSCTWGSTGAMSPVFTPAAEQDSAAAAVPPASASTPASAAVVASSAQQQMEQHQFVEVVQVAEAQSPSALATEEEAGVVEQPVGQVRHNWGGCDTAENCGQTGAMPTSTPAPTSHATDAPAATVTAMPYLSTAALAGMSSTATLDAYSSSDAAAITTAGSSPSTTNSSSSGGGAAAAVAFLVATCAAGVVAAAVLAPSGVGGMDASALSSRASAVLNSTMTQTTRVRTQVQSQLQLQLSALAGNVSAVQAQVAAVQPAVQSHVQSLRSQLSTLVAGNVSTVQTQMAAVQPAVRSQVQSLQSQLSTLVASNVSAVQTQMAAVQPAVLAQVTTMQGTLQPLVREGVSYMHDVQDQAAALQARAVALVAESSAAFRRG